MKIIFKKQLWFTVITILCLAIITLFVATRCNKPEKKLTTCNVNNPLTDLPWLKEVIDGFEKGVETGYKQHARIYQCAYKGNVGFLLELCIGCPDAGYSLVNCEGETLCVLWGLAGDSCTEFEIDFENKKLIWEINKR